MSILSRITKPRLYAPRITIFGKPGIGKTSFACNAPKPLILCTERGLPPECNGVDILPITSYREMIEALKSLIYVLDDRGIPYETIVIDSITSLDRMVIDCVISEDDSSAANLKVKSINTVGGGYGKGPANAKSKHEEIVSLCDALSSKGKTIIYIAHSLTVKVDLPDSEPFDQYDLQLHSPKSSAIYANNPDVVLYACQRITVNSKTKNAGTDSRRIIKTGLSASSVTKNRYNLPEVLPLEWGAFAKLVPYYQELAAAKTIKETQVKESKKAASTAALKTEKKLETTKLNGDKIDA